MPKLTKIKSIDSNGVTQFFNSIAQAAEFHKCDESSIRKALNNPDRRSCGKAWYTVKKEVISEAPVNTEELSPEFLDNMKSLGIKKEDLGLVWAKQRKDGTFRYSISFKKDKRINFDNIIDSFKLAVQDTNPIAIPQTSTNSKTLLIYSSDKHLGAKTNENSMFSNLYNKEEFGIRMSRLVQEIITLYLQFGKFDRLIFIDLGDAIDGLNGQTTRGGHVLPQNMTLEEAFDTYFSNHKTMFDCFVGSDVANNYEFRALSNDNHSGAVGHLAYRGLEIYLNATYPQIYTEISDKFITHFTCGKHTFMLSHGKDREDRAKGLPLVLDEKTHNFITSYMDYFNLSSSVGFTHFIKGDLHQSSSQLTKKFRYRNCLSMYGASAWIQNNFGGNTVAGVSMDIVDSNLPKVLEHNLIF